MAPAKMNKSKMDFVSVNSIATTACTSSNASHSEFVDLSPCRTPRNQNSELISEPMINLTSELMITCQVKNTFLNFIGTQELAPAMVRSNSAPAVAMQAEWKVHNQQQKKVWASRQERDQAKAQMDFLHGQGRCRPCLYFAFKADSCRNAEDCDFCHRCSREEVLARKKQQKSATRRAKDMSCLHWTNRRSNWTAAPQKPSYTNRRAEGRNISAEEKTYSTASATGSRHAPFTSKNASAKHTPITPGLLQALLR